MINPVTDLPSTPLPRFATARAIAQAVRTGHRSAVSVIQDTFSNLRAVDPALNCVTHMLEQDALEQAARIDCARQAGAPLPPLPGVPFGVKDLFDIAGHVTTAGSKVLRHAPCARQDAAIVQRLKAAGAIPVAKLNMDEFAYGFATDNAHYGVTRNPHDPTRMAGGSSGGSAAAVAAGVLPFTLGSDTNGSIRVPAALCGTWGIKPTFGRLPRDGAYPFSASLDVVGSFAGTLDDLIDTFHIMDGVASGDAPAEPDAASLRVARLGGWFASSLSPALTTLIEQVCTRLNVTQTVELPHTASARAASFLITAAEGGNLHLPRLRQQADDYDPATRDRFLAGAMLASSTYLQAQRFRSWFHARIHQIFEQVDVLIAPAVMCEAPLLDDPTILVDGKPVAARANLGLYTQPLTLAGVPVLAAPLLQTHTLPLGLQLVAAPGQEPALFSIARKLEREGVLGTMPIPAPEYA